MTAHLETFAWIVNVAFDGHFLTEKDILDKIREQKNPQQRLENIHSQHARIVKLVLQYKKELGSVVAKQIDVLQEAIYFRSWRTERFYRNAQYLQRFFAEIAKRMGIQTHDTFFLTYSEISEALDGKALPLDISERKRGYVMFTNADATRIYSGTVVAESVQKIRFMDEHGSQETLKGQQSYPGVVQGKVCVIHSKSDFNNMKQGMILVSHSTTPDYVPLIKMAIAIVTDEGGVLSHASVISRELHVPCVIGTKHATKVFKDGDMIEVDATNGSVRRL